MAVTLRNLKLTTKFMLGIGIILLFFWCIFSWLLYTQLKNIYIKETYEKADILLGHIDATMEYVRDDLRPKMFHVLPKGTFVLEAMSTSFVNKGIMEKFRRIKPQYIYRRVAMDPTNPANKVNAFEEKFIRRCSQYPKRQDWKGLVKNSGKRYFIHIKGVVMERECLLCHGNPADAPKSLIEKYGNKNGFFRKVGDIIGAESVAIPVDETFYRIRQIALSTFLVGIIGLVMLFTVVNLFINTVMVSPLKKVSAFFKSVVQGEKELDASIEVKSRDEIGELSDSFNKMASFLRHSQERLKEHSENLEHLVEKRTQELRESQKTLQAYSENLEQIVAERTRELRTSELKYRRIFEGSKDAIIVTDCQGFIIDINNSGVELFGCNNKDEFIKNMSMYDFFINKESIHEFLNLMERDGFVKDYEAVFKKKDRSEINALITATFRKDEENNICGYECIVKDITERKRIQQQLIQADKLASVGKLAAGVAHEINNPLSIILGYTRLLMEEGSFSKQMRGDLDAIQNNAHACKRIVEDLLNFSRQSETRRTNADINEIIEAVVSVVENKFISDGINIQRNYEPSLPVVVVDIDKIKQVFMNLLINAYQAMQSGGRISISTDYDAEKEQVRIVFSDTGHGISRDIHDRIFDPFFTTKEPGEGTGLGLSVSYGIIKEHGGEIYVESEEGDGTTFTVLLPLRHQTG